MRRGEVHAEVPLRQRQKGISAFADCIDRDTVGDQLISQHVATDAVKFTVPFALAGWQDPDVALFVQSPANQLKDLAFPFAWFLFGTLPGR